MKEELFCLTRDQIKDLIKESIFEYHQNELLKKPQLTAKEISDLYGRERFLNWKKFKLLNPISQNGKGAKIYYLHSAVIKLSKESHHYFTEI